MDGKKRVIKCGNLEISKARLHRVGNRLFVLSRMVNHLYDISDAENPTLVSVFYLLGQGKDTVTFMGKVEEKAYFGIGYNAIEVVDFSNEAEPRSVGMMSEVLIGSKWALLSNNFLIVNAKRPVVYRMSLSYCMHPEYEFPEDCLDFAVFDNKLISATLYSGIKVYDISSPANPKLISMIDINAIKIIVKDTSYILVEGADSNIYILKIKPDDVEIVTKIKIPGPIASNSILSLDQHLLLRYMQKLPGDTIIAFDLTQVQHCKKMFELTTINTPLYLASHKILILAGIEGWDGISSTANLSKNIYKIFYIGPRGLSHIDDIKIENIWFSSVLLVDSVLYIARRHEINLFKIPDIKYFHQQF